MSEMLQCHPVLALNKKKIAPAAIFFGNTQDVYKKYIHDRNKASTEYYTIHNNEITLQYVL